MLDDSPPLYGIDGYGPLPAKTAWMAAADGLQLRTAVFAADRPRGTAVLNTGRTEFIEKFYEVIGELNGRGLTVLTHDWRGQGLSQRLLDDRLKGHAHGADAFLDDFDRLLAVHADLPRPWILVGHSMGGALSLLHLLRGGSPFDAAVLSSPMAGVNLHGRTELEANLAILAQNLLGHAKDYQSPPAGLPWDDVFAGNEVTHDAGRFARTVALLQAHNDLALSGPTWGWVDFALHAAKAIQAGDGAKVTLPLRVVAAGDERLADAAATQRFCAKIAGAQCLVADGAFHEILMETDPVRGQFWEAFDAVTAGLLGAELEGAGA